MKHDWEYKKLGELGSFQRGKGIQKTHFVTNGMPCIHYGQIHTTFGVSTLNHISEIPQDLYEQSIIASKGDVLLALTSEDVEGSCKSTAWLGDYDVAISSDAAVFKHNLNPKFVVYYTQTKAFFIEKSKYARGFKVTHIKTSDIETIPIPVPSIEIQSLIVSELDSLSQIIADCKETLKDYDALEQSIFYDMFGDPVKNDKGWDVKKLGEVCVNLDSKRIPITQSEREKGEYPYYGASGIVDYVSDYIFDGTYLLVSEDGANLLARSTPIAFTIKGKNWVNNHAHILEFEYYCTQLYIEHHINNIDISQYVTGAAQPKLTQAKLNLFNIPLPPLPLQQQFASKIEAIEKMKSETKKALQEAETLFNARMDYWFN